MPRVIMKKLAFVFPWFHTKLTGDVEIALRELTRHLADAGIALEILTTCVEGPDSDWSEKFFPRGLEQINNIKIRRFKTERRNADIFTSINDKLMNNLPLSLNEEVLFLTEMINSDELTDYIATHKEYYSLFVFAPYLVGTTYFGITAAGKKAALIPFFNDEASAKMELVAQQVSKVSGMAFFSQTEADFAQENYNLSFVDARVLKFGVESIQGDALRFRKKHGLGDVPFLLYVGHKNAETQTTLLLQYFVEYRRLYPESELQLVLINSGQMSIPVEIAPYTIGLGVLPAQDQYDAYAAARVSCQLSQPAYFPCHAMESLLAGCPMIVNEKCSALKNFAADTGGGVPYNSGAEFISAVHYFVSHPEQAAAVGKDGQAFVRKQYDWDKVTNDYIAFFEELAARAELK